jgi:uncharacterized protein YwgA
MAKSDLLLLIAGACNGAPVKGKTRLVKLAYIVSNEIKKISNFETYSFESYYYGPFSNELINDLEILCKNGLISHETKYVNIGYYENVYKITEKGKEVLSEKFNNIDNRIIKIVEDIKKKYNDMPLSLLIQEVYKKYPLYKFT